MKRSLRSLICILLFLMMLMPVFKAFAAEEDRVEVAIVGDMMALSAQIQSAYKKTGEYDFHYAFKYVAPVLQNADLCIGNLETPVAGKKYGYTSGGCKNGYPFLNAPDSFLDAVKQAGFDILGTANNHCLDCGIEGLKNTVTAIETRQMFAVGTYKTKEAASNPLIYEVKGIRFAVLCYTQWTNSCGNGLDKTKRYVYNQLSVNKVQKDIAKAKGAGADAVIVLLHWGSEGAVRSNAGKKSIAKAIAKAGADIIIGAHPHVLQETASFTSDTPYGQKKCFVAYSMGNFISSMSAPSNKDSAIIRLQVKKDEHGALVFEKPECIATYTTNLGKNKFVVLPYYETQKFTSSAKLRSSLKSAYSRVSRKLNTKYVSMLK